ncbi:MAG: rubrerythrin [Desulfobacteraceae bacterium 4484_190.1]|nr:MAG: rubrerythrin [Desulfobacteraceae bacterium 4484_190.1]
MPYVFNMNEILEMAEQIERNGAAFYRKAAEGISDSQNRELLLELAQMEVEHEKTFASLRAQLSEVEETSALFDPEGETVFYLRALADTRVFFEKKTDTASLEEILKEALTAEKDSIVFYLGMKELVPEKYGKGKIDSIIKEEMGHIKLLGKKLVELR